MRISAVVTVCWLVVCAHSRSPEEDELTHSLQDESFHELLNLIGVHGKDLKPKVTKGKSPRKGDSPIYYIKLPPLPYFYSNDPVLPFQPYKPIPQFTQVPIDFTNNGRPEQVYHWHMPPSTSNHVSLGTHVVPDPFAPLEPIGVSNEIVPSKPGFIPGFPIVDEPAKPLTSSYVTPKPDKKPHVSLNKSYVSNGKPYNLYIWKPSPHHPLAHVCNIRRWTDSKKLVSFV